MQVAAELKTLQLMWRQTMRAPDLLRGADRQAHATGHRSTGWYQSDLNIWSGSADRGFVHSNCQG
jgi:hypothetical protein